MTGERTMGVVMGWNLALAHMQAEPRASFARIGSDADESHAKRWRVYWHKSGCEMWINPHTGHHVAFTHSRADEGLQWELMPE